MSKLINRERLVSMLNYDPDSGVFTWLVDSGKNKTKGRVAGCTRSDGYIFIGVDGTQFRAHRLAWFYFYGVWPRQIDHIDGCRNNNRLSNLREVSASQNNRNRGISDNNSSGVVGVYWFKRTGMWRAQIKSGGKNIHLGYFKSIEDAATARFTAEMSKGFHPNHGKRPAHGFSGSAGGYYPC